MAKKRKKQSGGVLRGPSHAHGGIPAVISGNEPVELEGGEYIIRKSSVDKYGEGTIARINQGLVDPAKLRQLKKGGKVIRRENMARRRKMQNGGNIGPNGGSGASDPGATNYYSPDIGGSPGEWGGGPSSPGGNVCPPGTHWMPSAGDQPGYCMQGASHITSPTTRGRAMRETRDRNVNPSPMMERLFNQTEDDIRRREYQRGGRTGRRRMQTGGTAVNQCPAGQYMQGGQCVSSAGSGMSGGYRRGGRINKKRVRRMNDGGYVYRGTNQPYSGRVVQQGGRLWSTKGGAKEGSSRIVEMKKGGRVIKRR